MEIPKVGQILCITQGARAPERRAEARGRRPPPAHAATAPSGGGGERARPGAAGRRTVSAHLLYQRSYGINWGLGEDSVPQVEEMARSGAERIEHTAHRFADRARWSEKRGGIEVSLQRYAPGGNAPRFA